MADANKEYMLGRNLATIAVYTGIRAEQAVVGLLDKGGEGKTFAELSPREQGYFAATFNVLLNQALNDEAREKMLAKITGAVTPENLIWLNEHRARPKDEPEA